MDQITYCDYYDSPLGKMLLTANDHALTGLHFVGEKYYPAIDPAWRHRADARLIVRIRLQLDEYFAGDRQAFDIAVEPAGTEFQRVVWRALQKIPYGVTENYGALANRPHRAQSARPTGVIRFRL